MQQSFNSIKCLRCNMSHYQLRADHAKPELFCKFRNLYIDVDRQVGYCAHFIRCTI